MEPTVWVVLFYVCIIRVQHFTILKLPSSIFKHPVLLKAAAFFSNPISASTSLVKLSKYAFSTYPSLAY
jgi:hypothetical protein